MKKIFILIACVIALVFLPTTTMADVRFSSIAYVNLLTDLNIQRATGICSAVTSSESASAAYGFGTASMAGLSAEAGSYGTGLMHLASGLGFISVSAKVLGNTEGLDLPITIHANIKGGITAYTAYNDLGSVAVSRIYWNSYDGHSNYGLVCSQAGKTIYYKGMSNSHITSSITPVFAVSIVGFSFELTNEDLVSLGLDPLMLDLVDTPFWSSVAEIICGAIETLGLASHNILPGVEISVGLDMKVNITGEIMITKVIKYNGNFLLCVGASSSSSRPPANGTAYIDATLTYATVPFDFQGDINNISIDVDGVDIPLMRE